MAQHVLLCIECANIVFCYWLFSTRRIAFGPSFLIFSFMLLTEPLLCLIYYRVNAELCGAIPTSVHPCTSRLHPDNTQVWWKKNLPKSKRISDILCHQMVCFSCGISTNSLRLQILLIFNTSSLTNWNLFRAQCLYIFFVSFELLFQTLLQMIINLVCIFSLLWQKWTVILCHETRKKRVHLFE